MPKPSFLRPAVSRGLWSLAAVSCLLARPVAASEPAATPFDHLEWRSIGPVNMSGRVADVEGVPGDPKVVYVGSASGGVWKTDNGGLTFEPIFDDQPIASIGDLALAPSNPEVVYVGTGESNTRNSVSFGNGVYKSTDGGQSWKHLGLEQTRHIARIVVNSRDPDVVFVGALGHIFGSNPERGVYRSKDGGASWEKVLYVDDRHGVSDLAIDPSNPNILYAAFWHFERKPWTHRTGSEDGGVWRSIDGGDTWEKLEEGLPRLMGRIGVKVAPSNPQVVYVIAESNEGTLFRSRDRGKNFEKVSDNVRIVSRGFYYTDMRVDPSDENRIYAVSSRLFLSIDGGKSFERISRSTHVDYHSLWVDPSDPNRLWQGQDGGVAVSYDRGESWEPIRNLPLGQFYQIFHDNREPFYYVGGGLQDNGTWYGPSRTREPAGILEDDWRMMSFGDAYWVVPHPHQEDLFLSESQAGGIVRTDMRTRQQVDVSPQPRRNDGGPVEELEYRFNWNAPIIASPHDPMTVYFAANVIFKTTDFGDTWEVISPDLTTDDPQKQGEAGGPAWTENTTAEYHCTIISLAESPARAGVLWAGTDDGRLHVSQNGGGSWVDVTAKIPGIAAFSPVSHVEPSRVAAGTAFVAFDRHMFDDFQPYIFKTDDFGESWTRVTAGIDDEAWVWVVRQDPRNPALLWAGTELGLFASYDGGSNWVRLHLDNLPTVAVHDLLIHPRDNDLILGTHGRAIWIFDDATPLQQFGPHVEDEAAFLFDVRPTVRFPARFTRYGLGDKRHAAPNPPVGALITYYLREAIEPSQAEKGESQGAGKPDAGAEGESEAAAGAEQERLKLEILDASGEVIRSLDADALGKKAGFNRVAWDLAMERARQRRDEDPEPSDFREPPRGPLVLPGTYTVRLTLDGQSWERPVEVRVDSTVPVTPEELKAQFDMAQEITNMLSLVNDGLRGLDTVTAQLEARRQAVEMIKSEITEEVETAWKEYESEVAEITLLLARQEDRPYWSQGPRLSERLDELGRNIDSQFTAPTAAQAAYFEELKLEFQQRLAEVNRLLTQEVSRLNLQLEGAGVPPVAIPDAIEIVGF